MAHQLPTWTWTTIPDKATWGPGPWIDEPDRAAWVDPATGLQCQARRHIVVGAWCGYVAVRADHPLYGLPEHDERLNGDWEVELNFAGESQGSPDYGPMDESGLWWFGFDCAHGWDYSPKMMSTVGDVGLGLDLYEVENYKTLDYVREQCAKIAWCLSMATAAQLEGPVISDGPAS